MSRSKVDLSSFIAKDGTYALNADDEFPLANLYNPDSRFQVRSDADEQMILHFQFSEKVKLSGVSIQAPTGDMQPVKIRLFTNKISIDFADAESLPASFEAELSDDDITGEKELELKVVKFSSIDSVTVFIESSKGGDLSALSCIKFFGATVDGTNMNELKKSG